MPKLIDEAVDIMNFWRKSKANLVKMVLSTVFLIVMAGMLPSLGLTNLKVDLSSLCAEIHSLNNIFIIWIG